VERLTLSDLLSECQAKIFYFLMTTLPFFSLLYDGTDLLTAHAWIRSQENRKITRKDFPLPQFPSRKQCKCLSKIRLDANEVRLCGPHL
jgi:hypothetical protein